MEMQTKFYAIKTPFGYVHNTNPTIWANAEIPTLFKSLSEVDDFIGYHTNEDMVMEFGYSKKIRVEYWDLQIIEFNANAWDGQLVNGVKAPLRSLTSDEQKQVRKLLDERGANYSDDTIIEFNRYKVLELTNWHEK